MYKRSSRMQWRPQPRFLYTESDTSGLAEYDPLRKAHTKASPKNIPRIRGETSQGLCHTGICFDSRDVRPGHHQASARGYRFANSSYSYIGGIVTGQQDGHNIGTRSPKHSWWTSLRSPLDINTAPSGSKGTQEARFGRQTVELRWCHALREDTVRIKPPIWLINVQHLPRHRGTVSRG